MAYRRDIQQFLEYVAKPFDQTTVIDIMGYQSRLADQYGEDKTRARKLASVCSFYRFLNNREVTNVNLSKIERGRIERGVNHDKLLTPEQVRAIIAVVEADALHHALLRFFYLTGVRISEALGLRWRDLRKLPDGGEAHIIGKRRKYRLVFVSDELWMDLMSLRGAADDAAYVFPLGENHVRYIVRKAGKVAGVEGAHPHQFRHAFVSHLLAEGVPLPDVSELAGHSSVAMTSVYAHPTKGRNVTEKLKVR